MHKGTNITEWKTAIKFIPKFRIRMKNDSFIKFYRENWWWKDTVSYNCFYDRVKHWWDWKEAIKAKKNKYELKIQKYKPKEKPNPEKTFIDVKYQPEEARIFKESFENIINSLEEQYEREENPADAKEIMEKINQAKREYEMFLHHNL